MPKGPNVIVERNRSEIRVEIVSIEIGTVDQDDADVEWSLRPFMRSAKKQRQGRSPLSAIKTSEEEETKKQEKKVIMTPLAGREEIVHRAVVFGEVVAERTAFSLKVRELYICF